MTLTGALRPLALITLPLLAACTAPAGPTQPAWYDDFDPGPFAVGLRTGQLQRTAPDGSERTLTLSIWYPAVEGSRGDPVRLGDLFRIALDEGQLEEAEGMDPAAAFPAAMTGSAEALSRDASIHALDSPTLALWDAEPVPGPLPLVLWSVRHATALAQAPISEVLASNGAVVATVWSSDPPLAFLWEDRTEEDKRATIDVHTGDLVHTLSELRADPSIDGDRVTVLSWSYGGQTAAALQELDDGVRGIVGLDANVLPARPEERLELKRPLVFVVGGNAEGRGIDVLEELTAPWVQLRLPGLAHGSFNAMEGYLPNVLGAESVFPWAQTGSEAREGYRALSRIAREAVFAFSAPAPVPIEELVGRLEEAVGDVPAELRHSERPPS